MRIFRCSLAQVQLHSAEGPDLRKLGLLSPPPAPLLAPLLLLGRAGFAAHISGISSSESGGQSGRTKPGAAPSSWFAAAMKNRGSCGLAFIAPRGAPTGLTSGNCCGIVPRCTGTPVGDERI